MVYPLVLGAVLSVLAQQTAAQGYFSLPCQKPPSTGTRDFSKVKTFPLNSEMDVAWNTNITNFNILLMQEKTTDPGSKLGPIAFQRLEGQAETDNIKWKVEVNDPLDYSVSPIYYFSLYETGDTSPSFSSCYFNITEAISSSSSVASTSTPTSSPSVSTLPAGASPTTTGATSVPNDEDKKDNSMKIGIGLGVGLGVGIPLLIAVAVGVIFWIRHMKKMEASKEGGYAGINTHQPPMHMPGDGTTKYAYNAPQPELYDDGSRVSELPDASRPHELDGGPNPYLGGTGR